MQLIRGGALLATLLVLLAPVGARRAHADVEASTHFTLFSESSTAGAPVQVLHPQTDVAADLGKWASISAGYAVDVVSGATPVAYGSTDPVGGVDTISGATKFSDLRQQTQGGLTLNTPLIGLSAGYSYGWESDYRSHTLSAAARGDFLERNFTLGLAYTRNFDSICDQNNAGAQGPLDLLPLVSSENCFKPDAEDTVTQKATAHTFEPSLAWTATPRVLLQAGATLQVVEGFQSSPYRKVFVGSQARAPQEHLPTLRQRYAGFARARYALPEVRAALAAMVRLYRDTWDVRAVTAEGELLKYLGPQIIVGLHGRYHLQGGAIFYRRAIDYRLLGPVGQYWTGDRELAPLHTLLGGAKLTYLRRPEQSKAWFDEFELSAKFDLMRYFVEPGGPNTDRKTAFITQVGLALRF